MRPKCNLLIDCRLSQKFKFASEHPVVYGCPLMYNHLFHDLLNKKVMNFEAFESMNLWPQLMSGETMQFIYNI